MVAKKPKLSLVQPACNPEAIADPPRQLYEAGLSLWERIQSEYAVTDAGGVELLLLACEATDRAADCAEAIERDGPVIMTKGGPKPHPLLKEEIGNRALVSRLIHRLGLDVEPLRPGPGRPAGR